MQIGLISVIAACVNGGQCIALKDVSVSLMKTEVKQKKLTAHNWVHFATEFDGVPPPPIPPKVNVRQSQLPHPDSQRQAFPCQSGQPRATGAEFERVAHLDGVHLLNKLLDLIDQTLVLLLRRLLHPAALSQLRAAERCH